MLKRIELVRGSHELQLWRQAVAHAASDAGPVRAVACTSERVSADEPAYAALSIAWFADLASLLRFEAQLGPTTPRIDPGASVRIVAEEVVLRGADWLAQRWTLGGPKWKHMALARRAADLTPAEFCARWRTRSGRIGGAVAVTIPERARGLAYVQNHPLPSDVEWGYDAINEVYFDDLEQLRARLDFFQQHDAMRTDADLVSRADFLVVREAPVL